MKASEKKLHKAVCKYLRLQYPDVIFLSDQSGLYTNRKVGGEMKLNRNPPQGIPDIIILEPKGGLHGLCIELKQKASDVFKLNGELKKNDHTERQANVLHRLSEKGYLAWFACGLDDAIEMIDDYMALKDPAKLDIRVDAETLQKELLKPRVINTKETN